MSVDALAAVKVPEVCKKFALTEAGAKVLQPQFTAKQFVEALIAREQFMDAVHFLANALPKREAVWWACACARLASPTMAPPVAAALAAAEKWVADPKEDNRRATMPAAEAAGMGTPAGCAAAAAFWSGGSLGPPNVPVVAPPELLTGKGVGGAVLLAAVLSEPEKATDKYRKYLAAGLDIARGANRWK